jgi:hypothetical protein
MPFMRVLPPRRPVPELHLASCRRSMRRLHCSGGCTLKLWCNRLNKACWIVRRKNSENAAMSKRAELPKSGATYPDTGVNLAVDPVLDASPAQFGRLALWVASASALAVGVAGTAAYGIWFNHDQRLYIDALANAREALRMSGATSPTHQTPSSDPVTQSTSPSPLEATVVSTQAALPASSALSDQGPAPSAESAALQVTTAQPAQVNCAIPQSRRRSTSPVRPNSGASSRTSAAFYHVSYRHGTGSQRDTYAHQ